MSSEILIIDSHVHLYPESEVSTLAWCKPDHALAKQQSVEQYRAATKESPLPVKGLVLIEADRKNDEKAGETDGSGWEHPLAEIGWMARVAEGRPREGEGHTADDKSLVAALIPWAPLPSGAAVMEKYLERAREAAGESWSKVRGFRYLVQDKPDRTMLGDGFIEGLKLLGRKGYVFDLGIDQHGRGRTQLEEAVEMIDRAHDCVPEDEKVTFIMNHMCKPDLTVYNIQTSPSFIAWRTAMFTLSKCSRTYIKLSGGLAEMPESLRTRSPEDIFNAISPWLSVLLAAFGPSRLMYGSDWPVCTMGVAATQDEKEPNACDKWRRVVDRMCWMMSYEEEDSSKIWGGTTLKAYGIEP